LAFYPWPTATPESQGVDSAHLMRLLDHVRAEPLNLHSLLIARHGHLIAEAYFHPYHAESRHDVRSAAKSVTALLVGIMLNEGYIAGLDQPISDFFPVADARQAAITIRHLLTMSSGLALSDADTWHTMVEPDALAWVLSAPMAAEPGAVFNYCSSNTYLLSAILQQVTGVSLADYARERLFLPLGISSSRWQNSQQGITYGWGGLWLAARDFAALGQLVLDRGRHADRPIVPESWIDTITRVQVAEPRYGFGWWIEPERGAVAMTGYGGQVVHITPGRDLVVAITAGLGDFMPALHHLLDAFILPALHDTPLPAHPTADDIAARIAALGQPHPQPLAPLPDTAARISGQRWTLGENGLGLSAITLTFGDSPLLTLEAGDDRADLPLGLDGVLRDVLVAKLGPLADQDRMAAVGGWQDDHTLVMQWYSVNNPEYWSVTITFGGAHARLRWDDRLTGYAETVDLTPHA
jgi:CubicO group peptidase (beta-lactamase class C family)